MTKELTIEDIKKVRERSRQNSTAAVVTGDVVEAESEAKEVEEKKTQE